MRERLTVTAKNEACTGVRFSSSSQSSCGGRSDLEVEPTINPNGTLSVTMNAPNGGLMDMGSASSLPDPSELPGGTLSPQGSFQQGHVYLVRSGANLSLIRVIRINSNINPKLGAALSGQPSGSGTRAPAVRNSGSMAAMMSEMRDQQTADQVMKSARITIDLEWIPVQNQGMGTGGTN
jgi:hypothetical protein